MKDITLDVDKRSLASIKHHFTYLSPNADEKKLINALLAVYSAFLNDNRFKYFDSFLSHKSKHLANLQAIIVLIVCGGLSHELFNNRRVIKVGDIEKFTQCVNSPSIKVKAILHQLLDLSAAYVSTQKDLTIFLNMCVTLKMPTFPKCLHSIGNKHTKVITPKPEVFRIDDLSKCAITFRSPAYTDVGKYYGKDDAYLLEVTDREASDVLIFRAKCYLIDRVKKGFNTEVHSVLILFMTS